MIDFNIAGTVVDSDLTDLRGLSDIKIVTISGAKLLVVASESDSAITTFRLDAFGGETLADTQRFNAGSGTGRLSALNFAQLSGETVLLPATRYENQTAFYTLAQNGDLSAPLNGGVAGQGIGLNETVQIGDNTFVFVQDYGGQYLTSYALGSNLALSRVQKIKDNERSFLGDISALDHIKIGLNTYLLVASAFDAGLGVYLVGQDGHLSLWDTVAPGEGSGFARIQDLATFEIDGQAYVAMAAAGTSSLTIYRVRNNGQLVETDYLLDDLETRFQNASLVEAFTFGGRQFLVSAGSDDGITILEVLAGGRLQVEASLADTYDITLDNVSGIAIEIINNIPVLYVSSATEHGFTRIELDIKLPPPVITGTNKADDLQGTEGEDVIKGRGGDDILHGLGKADRLIDGAGSDQMHGGAGRDVFVFVKDGETDTILDFRTEWDVIDLTAFDAVSGFDDLRIAQSCLGTVIYVDGEFIILDNGQFHTKPTELTAAHFIF